MDDFRTFFSATWNVFGISFKPKLFSRRAIFITVLAILPVLAALLWWIGYGVFGIDDMPSGWSTFSFVMVYIVIQFLVPLVGLFYGTSLIADEVDAKTLTYLTTRPIPKATIPFGKYLSYALASLVLLIPPTVIAYAALTLGDGTRHFVKHLDDLGFDLLLIFLGLLAYGAVFNLIGIILRRSLVVGFLYAILWESLVSMVPYLTKLTVMHYLQSLSPHISETMGLITLMGQTATATNSIIVLVCV
ncbi:ABC transporter permease, partial [Acidobacteriota bacterium]